MFKQFFPRFLTTTTSVTGQILRVRLLVERVDQSSQEASFAFHHRSAVTALTSPQPGIEQVSHGVAEHIKRVDDNCQAKTGPERQPGRLLHVSTSIPAEHASPAGNLGRQTISEKAQGGLGNNHPPMLMEKIMMTGAIILGRTWRKRIWLVGVPTALAARK